MTVRRRWTFARMALVALLTTGGATATALATAGPAQAAGTGVTVFVGYADDLRPAGSFPAQWDGTANTVFIGHRGSYYDAGAIKLENPNPTPITIDGVQVDLQRPGPTYNLWGSFTIPPHSRAVLTQMGDETFDTSDFPISPCGVDAPGSDPRVPMVTVTIGGVPTSFLDTGHILDTHGYDLVCNNNANESTQWREIGGTSCVLCNATLTLDPATQSSNIGTAASINGTLTDPGGAPLADVAVNFSVTSGPNAGRTGSATTDGSGHVRFSYTGSMVGTDTVAASVTNASGGSFSSNPVNVDWINPPPTANAGGSYAGTEGAPIALIGATASDPNGDPLTYAWSSSDPGCTFSNATVLNPMLTCAEEGASTVTLAVSDGANPAVTATASVTVGDAPLAAAGTSIISANPVSGTVATFTDADPGGTVPDYSATINWGDGTGPDTTTPTITASGSGFAVTGSHSYAVLGPHTVTTHVCDAGGSCADATSQVLVFGYATGGSFVVGDHSASGAVTFWDAQWSGVNPLSTGAAPASFKGFAANPATPSCGAAWTTGPGNSAGPPTNVPSYVAVVVASTVTKSGSTISGDASHIVIVKTNPGYANSPGHPGTGTVVGVLC